MPHNDLVRRKVASLPQTPGVYLWKNIEGTIIYVGKAKRLRRRVESYHKLDHAESPKTQRLVQEIADIEWIETPTESDALALEETLIKRHRPKYNVALVHSHGYPYVKITTGEPFPRLMLVHTRSTDEHTYLGPFTDPGRLRAMLEIIRRRFFVRTCTYDLPKDRPARPCLEFHIKRCKAPCVGYQSEQDYRSMIDSIRLLLEGKTTALVSELTTEMLGLAEKHSFERAGEIRDQIKALETATRPPVTVLAVTGDRDVFGMSRDMETAVVVWLKVRQGRLIERDMAVLGITEDATEADILWRAISERYCPSPDRSGHLVLGAHKSSDTAELELRLQEFSKSQGCALRSSSPSKGVWHELVEMATTNAQNLLDDLRLSTGAIETRTDARVTDLQRELGLAVVPRAMVCFDISHGAGRDTVASVTRFTNGRPDRSLYRTYTVKTVEGIDDFASMREVVARWASRVAATDIPAPDLIVIDGGPGQLSSALEALKPFGLSDISIIALAKREEEIFLPATSEPIRLGKHSPARLLLQDIRDETHRTAVQFHRKRKTGRTIATRLSDVPGLGPKRVKTLLSKFGSLAAVKRATAQELTTVPGISLSLATRILEYLSTPEATPAPAAPLDLNNMLYAH